MTHFSINALKAIQWIAGQTARNNGATFAKFAFWASKHLNGGKEGRRQAWEELYNARLVDTLDPNDSYVIRW